MALKQQLSNPAQSIHSPAQEILSCMANHSKRLGLPCINSYKYGLNGLSVLRGQPITISEGKFKGSDTKRLIVRYHEDGARPKAFLVQQAKPPIGVSLFPLDEKADGKLEDFNTEALLLLHSNANKAFLGACTHVRDQSRKTGEAHRAMQQDSITVPASGFFRGGVLHQSITLSAVLVAKLSP